MTTFEEFQKKYTGQKNVGNTPENTGECVGLSSLWMDNFNVPHLYGHAMDLYKNASTKDFIKIPNTPEAVVQKGDIVIWGKGYNGTFGHTGIATGTNTDANRFDCFQQNDPLNSTPHIKNYNYAYVTGWLRPKMYTNPPVSEHSEKDVNKLDKSDQIKRAYKALTGVWVKQEEIDPWLKKDLSLDDTMIEIMKGDRRFKKVWIEPELKKLEEDIETLRTHIEQYKKQNPQAILKEDDIIVETVKTYPVTDKNPSNSMDKPKPVSIDPVFSGPFVNLLQFLKKKLGL